MAKRAEVYWDSSAFLALINQDKTEEQLAACRQAWESAKLGKLFIVTSVFTCAEVIYMKGTPKLDHSKRMLVTNFFRESFISLRPLTREIAELSRDVVWDTPIKPKDAVHVATAAYRAIIDFHTFDEGLCRLSSVTVNGVTLSLCNPKFGVQAEMEFSQGKSDRQE